MECMQAIARAVRPDNPAPRTRTIDISPACVLAMLRVFILFFVLAFPSNFFFQHPPHPTAISPLSRPEPCLSKIAGGLLGLRSGGGEGRGGSGSRLLPAAPQGRPRRLCWPGPPAAAASTRTSIDPRLLVVLLSGPPVGPQRPPAQEVA